ncbi:hypothetical protein HanIR_Chr04g0187181 [Helianthus annuus]|nr:hypothetical protein HanIR_Chr04g0187181 [Helianthus annuus]
MLPQAAMRLAPHHIRPTSGTDTPVQVAPMTVICQDYVSNRLTWRNLHTRQA